MGRDNDDPRDSGRCMWTACICCYRACDCNNPICLVKQASDVLCIRHSCCLALNSPLKGCGCTTDKDRGEICKLGCLCCDLGLIYPTKICGCASQCLCCYDVASLPWNKEFVPEPVCTICCPGVVVCPQCGCCTAPPPCPALDKVLKNEPLPYEMQRN